MVDQANPTGSSNNTAQSNQPMTAQQRRKEYAKKLREMSSSYEVYGTVVPMSMKIGDGMLASTVKRQWQGISQSLHYITDFTRRYLKGKVATAANNGISEYINDKVETAELMMKTAMDKAENNGIRLGSPGTMNEVVVMVACQVERDVMDLIKLLDDYVIVVDSLWIGRVVDSKAQEAAHEDICRTINTLHSLLVKMHRKMIEYRRLKLTNRLTRTELQYAEDLEQLVFAVTGINIQNRTQANEAEQKTLPKPSKQQKEKKPAQSSEVSNVIPMPVTEEHADEQIVMAA